MVLKLIFIIDSVLIASVQDVIKKAQIQVLMSKIVSLKDFKVTLKQPKLFVVMQFSDDYNQLFCEVIKPVAEKFGFECIKADDIFTTGTILQDIINLITESSVIIADITPDNPNGFYEVGYSHAIGKPTILLCDRKRTKLPFDVSGFRTIFYDNTIAGKSTVEKSLEKFLTNII